MSVESFDEDEFRRRMYGFLQRRGFDYETVRVTTERLWQERLVDSRSTID